MSYENPVFSIITPTFRRPEMLVRNIKSVLNQTYGNYEHIIIDDGNDPVTDKIVESFNDGRLILVRHDQSRGAAAAYNSGIRKSRGEFIAFLDDDDEYMPEFLEKMYERFCAAGKETGFIWTGIERIIYANSFDKKSEVIKWEPTFLTKDNAMTVASSISNAYGLCIRRECLEKTGIYDEDLIVCCDTDFLIRLAENFKCETLPEVLVRIHKHDLPRLTSGFRNHERIVTRELLFHRYKDSFISYPKMYITHMASLCALCYVSDQVPKGRRAFFKLIKKKPLRVRTYFDLISLELTRKSISETSIGKLIKRIVRRVSNIAT